MTIRTQIVFGFATIVLIGLAYLFYWLVTDLEPQYRKSTEEPLIDTARVIAAIASTNYKKGKFDSAAFAKAYEQIKLDTFEAPIYDFTKTKVDLRIYVTDAAGKVVFDSSGRDLGQDFSEWRDVRLSLEGQYGARTTHDVEEPDLSTMYVGAPIKVGDKIVGVLSVGKPTTQANRFTKEARVKLIGGLTLLFIALIMVGSILSRKISGPIEALTSYARQVRDGSRAPLPDLGTGEIAELGVAFEEMRESLEGKKYIEDYVQHLTHEVKSPVSAIRGAAELLEGDPPAADRARFLKNIQTEAKRIQGIADHLLRLAKIESRRGLEDVEQVSLISVIKEIGESLMPLLKEKQIELRSEGEAEVVVSGEPFLLRQALVNLIQNSIDFCTAGKSITCLVHEEPEAVIVEVADNGPGIPDYALPRLFEKFYSLPRPLTGKKSTGLGLSFVQEIMDLHGGSVSLRNGESGGVVARLEFPKVREG